MPAIPNEILEAEAQYIARLPTRQARNLHLDRVKANRGQEVGRTLILRVIEIFEERKKDKS